MVSCPKTKIATMGHICKYGLVQNAPQSTRTDAENCQKRRSFPQQLPFRFHRTCPLLSVDITPAACGSCSSPRSMLYSKAEKRPINPAYFRSRSSTCASIRSSLPMLVSTFLPGRSWCSSFLGYWRIVFHYLDARLVLQHRKSTDARRTARCGNCIVKGNLPWIWFCCTIS